MPSSAPTPSITRYRVPGLLCAVVFLVCELVSWPFAEMPVCDDWSSIRTVQLLVQTGHIHYNGWEAPMLGWQLFPAAALLKLLGFSFTACRITTLLTAACMAFVMQRIFVRFGINERNATIATLAVVLSPLYMPISVTFMTDLQGVFAMVICMYGCVRALQTAADHETIGWLCFAVAGNAIFGTSRQIAWLGVLVMVPSTLWLLRDRRRALIAGTTAWLMGCLFVAAALHWYTLQPYSIPEHLAFEVHGVRDLGLMLRGLSGAFFELPCLILPLVVAYLTGLRKSTPRTLIVMAGGALLYGPVAWLIASHQGREAILEPLLWDWVVPVGHYRIVLLASVGPIVLSYWFRVWFTLFATLTSLFAFAFILQCKGWPNFESDVVLPSEALSWKQIGFLIVPFSTAYFLLLVPRSATQMLDRYLMVLLFTLALFLVRAYQDLVGPRLPAVTVVCLAIYAGNSIACNHDMFSLYRARIQIANEVKAAGVPLNRLDGGFELNGWVELQQTDHVNDEHIVTPPGAYNPNPPPREFSCEGKPALNPGEKAFEKEFPHFQPQYAVGYDPTGCGGKAPFAPVSYNRWLGKPGILYVVYFKPITR